MERGAAIFTTSKSTVTVFLAINGCVFVNSYFRCKFGKKIPNRQKYTYKIFYHWHKHSFYDKYTPMNFNVC